jgi:aryl-alcohol dehydrogenase-like predicted oxidoreductase
MQMKKLGDSALEVAPVVLGGNVFGWTADEKTSFGVLDAFVDAGFNMIDTADGYSAWAPGNQGGESETVIGRWLQRSGKRNKVLIATKVAKYARRPGLAPANIAAAAADSLARLGVDTIDLYYSHEDDPTVPIADTLGAYQRLIEAGKVRAIGASNFTAARVVESLAVAQSRQLPRYCCLQDEYNLMSRAGYESSLAALAREHGLGVLPYFALASGFLTGKYRGEADVAKSARGGGIAKKHFGARGSRVLAALDDVAARHRATPTQVALAWLLAKPSITAPIASATSVAQLTDILGAATLGLDARDVGELDTASA